LLRFMKILTYETRKNSILPDWAEGVKSILRAAGLTDFEVVSVSDDLRCALSSWNGKYDLLTLITKYVPDTINTRLFISAQNEHKYNDYCLAQAAHAELGCCLSHTVAIEYAPEIYRLTAQVHETLHLFGVEECYNEKTLLPKDSCKNSKCLMRYGVHSTVVCKDVLRQLQAKQRLYSDTR